MYLLGYDLGSSSVKATLLEAETGKVVSSATSPSKEMEIKAHQPGWAEQSPKMWWDNLKNATAEILSGTKIDPSDIKAIGISYQMHGLVLIDAKQQVLRDAIIWCDGRAVPIGEKATADIGGTKCLKELLNYPGNFTATRIKWVMDNEPDLYKKASKVMLPGDYIAMRLTGRACTTESGLSEMIMWDFPAGKISDTMLKYFKFDRGLFPDVVPTFGDQGELSSAAAAELGLKAGVKVAYRGGDQPNNALSLKVMEPGELATTAGTSGVVYGIGDKSNYDPQSRVNTFIHVNNAPNKHRYGVLMCINGTGILNSWLKHNVMGPGEDYKEMDAMAAAIPAGSAGLTILPFGNGAERTLVNKDIGASVHGLNFNIHTRSHLLRAGQEGIVFSLNYGLDIMRKMGIEIKTVRAGHANMFLSDVFSSAFATVTGATVELYNTDGSQGAARGAGLGAGVYKNDQDMFVGLTSVKTIAPDAGNAKAYADAYQNWLKVLQQKIK
ncbi:MAG: carbohydrate kinase [Sedimentisphaerales bacterium]|nr:carbohydrate kinase [Sedimentisphaerales bacterium]